MGEMTYNEQYYHARGYEMGVAEALARFVAGEVGISFHRGTQMAVKATEAELTPVKLLDRWLEGLRSFEGQVVVNYFRHNLVIVSLTTKSSTYTIRMHWDREDGALPYLGGQAGRRGREGGQDLADGSISEAVWARLLTDIVAYEVAGERGPVWDREEIYSEDGR